MKLIQRLEPWATGQHPDALWLHWPWQLTGEAQLPHVGVIYHHLPFEETLTTGFNRPWADSPGQKLGCKHAVNQADNLLPQQA